MCSCVFLFIWCSASQFRIASVIILFASKLFIVRSFLLIQNQPSKTSSVVPARWGTCNSFVCHRSWQGPRVTGILKLSHRAASEGFTGSTATPRALCTIQQEQLVTLGKVSFPLGIATCHVTHLTKETHEVWSHPRKASSATWVRSRRRHSEFWLEKTTAMLTSDVSY